MSTPAAPPHVSLVRMSIILPKADAARVAIMKSLLYPGKKTSVSRAGGLLMSWSLNEKGIPHPRPEDGSTSGAVVGK